MTDTVTVFNKDGLPIDELNVSVFRHQKLDHTVDLDRGSFVIAAADPKATDANLARNNIVYVESDKVGVKPFAALIWPDESTGLVLNSNSEYVVPLRGCEWLLGQRLTAPIEQIDPPQTPGNIFLRILGIAQRSGAFLPLSNSASNVSLIGTPIAPSWNLVDCYGITNTLATDSEMYWGFLPSRDYNVVSRVGSGRLILTPFFTDNIGKMYQTNIIARTSGGGTDDAANLVGGTISEKSTHPFANRIVAYGKMDDWKENIIYTTDDRSSQGECGVVEAVLSITTALTVEDLKPKADKELKMCRRRLYVDGTLIDVSEFPSIGDTCYVQPDYMGDIILSQRYGNILRMRVKETNYNPQNNTMAVMLEGLYSDE